MSTAPAHSVTGGISLVRTFTLVFGVVYLAIGVAGWFVLGDDGHGTLLVFGVNAVHNVIHLVIGAAAIVGSRRYAWSRTVLVVLGGVLGLVTVLGFFRLLEDLLGMEHGIADPDNFLHLATAVAALMVGVLSPAPSRRG